MGTIGATAGIILGKVVLYLAMSADGYIADEQGGASVAEQLLKENGIDKLRLSIIPMALGKGVRLFPKPEQELKLNLVGTEYYNGIVDLGYENKKNPMKSEDFMGFLTRPLTLEPPRTRAFALDIRKSLEREMAPGPCLVVEVTGFEPAASWSQTKRATNCATPR